MSTNEARRGQQGVQGVQGIEGEPGRQGKPGEGPKGERGSAGERGTRGRTGAQPRSVLLSFWAIVLISFVVLVGLGYAIWENKATIARVEAARAERVMQINRINQAQCASLRNLYSNLQLTIEQSDKTIDTLAYYRGNPQEKAAAHRYNRQVIGRFREPPCLHDIVLNNKG